MGGSYIANQQLAQQWLEHQRVISTLSSLRPEVSQKGDQYLQYYRSLDPFDSAFLDVQQWAPFFLIGDPRFRLRKMP